MENECAKQRCRRLVNLAHNLFIINQGLFVGISRTSLGSELNKINESHNNQNYFNNNFESQ